MKWKEAEKILGITNLKKRLGNSKTFDESLRNIASQDCPSVEEVEKIAEKFYLIMPVDQRLGKNEKVYLNRFFRVWSVNTMKEEFKESEENKPPFYCKDDNWVIGFEDSSPSNLCLMKDPLAWAKKNHIPNIPRFKIGKVGASSLYDRNKILHEALLNKRLQKFVKRRFFPIRLLRESSTPILTSDVVQRCLKAADMEIFQIPGTEETDGFLWYEDYAALHTIIFKGMGPDGDDLYFPISPSLEGQEESLLLQSSFIRAGKRSCLSLKKQYRSVNNLWKNVCEETKGILEQDPRLDMFLKQSYGSPFTCDQDILGWKNQGNDIPLPIDPEPLSQKMERLSQIKKLLSREITYIQQCLQLRYLHYFSPYENSPIVTRDDIKNIMYVPRIFIHIDEVHKSWALLPKMRDGFSIQLIKSPKHGPNVIYSSIVAPQLTT